MFYHYYGEVSEGNSDGLSLMAALSSLVGRFLDKERGVANILVT